MKSLLPSLKEKKRYVLFEVISNSFFNEAEISAAIRGQFNEFYGEIGLAEAGVQLISGRWDQKGQQGIIRVSNKSTDKLKSVFPFIRGIKNNETVVRSLGTSGILQKAQKKRIAG